VRVPPNFVVGENAEDDKKRFQVTPGGVVVIPREALLD
jgi:ADP-glucose pyrophosphorylase